MTTLIEIEKLQKLRSMRKMVSLQGLQQLDVKSQRCRDATRRAQDDLDDAEARAECFIASAMATRGGRTSAATFFSSMALGHRYAQLSAQTGRRQLERLLRREAAVKLEREELARVHLLYEQQYDQMTELVKQHRRDRNVRGEAVSEQEHQDMFANGGRNGTS